MLDVKYNRGVAFQVNTNVLTFREVRTTMNTNIDIHESPTTRTWILLFIRSKEGPSITKL